MIIPYKSLFQGHKVILKIFQTFAKFQQLLPQSYTLSVNMIIMLHDTRMQTLYTKCLCDVRILLKMRVTNAFMNIQFWMRVIRELSLIQCRAGIDRSEVGLYVRRLPGVAHRDLELFYCASLGSGVSFIFTRPNFNWQSTNTFSVIIFFQIGMRLKFFQYNGAVHIT